MIRKFEISDMNQLTALMKQHAIEAGEGIGTLDEDKLIEMIKKHNIQPGGTFLVAERQGQIKGYVMLSYYSNPWNGIKEGTIIFLYVDPEYRQGFMAKDLFSQSESYFREKDCKFFNASTRAFDESYKPNYEFIKSADGFFDKTMTHCGSHYIKEIL